ncbi:hypothetical protein GIB67_039458 [Kingdonia uniflora]|uniref:Protein kinase domain-containing protein n=1 Tax=Kingdonia uniflora TaxID=39325 RepID=A0A7J7LIZ6_9MAGN|nr:hypothetical protein GIB67_039458 [Kingdonia uniflora]
MAMRTGRQTALGAAPKRGQQLMHFSSAQRSETSDMNLTSTLNFVLRPIQIPYWIFSIDAFCFLATVLTSLCITEIFVLLCYGHARASDPEEAEAVAAIRGLEAAQRCGLSRVLLLTDCQRLVRAFRDRSDDLTWGALTLAPDLRALSDCFIDFCFEHIDRSCNFEAHCLAARGASSPHFACFEPIEAINLEIMAEEENGLWRVECLRGRLYAERLALKAANKNTDLMEKKLIEIEKELWLKIKQKNKAEKSLKLLTEKLESLKLPTVEWNSESSENINCCSSSATSLVLIAPEEQSFVSETMICSSYSCNSNKDLCLIEYGKDDNSLSEELTTYEFRKKGKAITMPFVPASCPPDLRRSSRTRYEANIARGVVGLHAAGVVYMNLKPSNLLLDASGWAVVSNYGLPAILKNPLCRKARPVPEDDS